jgi:peptidoglycan/LPS O-acetylase OafA/YrhL
MPESYELHVRFDAYRAQRVFGSLDGLRFICIAMVLWHHGTIWGLLEDPARILARGFAGVDFFFVLSGYLITTLLLREEAANGRFSIAGFYRRRVLRIVPVYFLAVTAVSFWWIVARGQEEWIPLVPYYYLFLANFLYHDIPLLAPMWSLAVEEQYYLIWPALLLLLPELRTRVILLVVLIAVCFLAEAGILPRIEPVPATEQARFLLPPGGFAAILIGSLTAVVLHQRAGYAALWQIVGHRWAPLILLGATALALHLLPPILLGWPNLIVHGLMALTVASLVVREDHVMAPALKLAPVAQVGKVSYGLYIWHLCGLHIGNETVRVLGLEGWTGAWVAMGVYLVASVVVAELSFRYFESYFLRLKDRPRRQPVQAPGE